MAAAQDQKSPPPILRVYVEQVKPGKSAAHEKSESAFARAFAKANFPAHYLALTAMAGANEVWFVEEHSSFAEVEHDEKVGEEPALKAELDQLDAADGESVAASRSLIGVYRSDLSYRAEQAAATMPKMRYVDVGTLRVKPGSETRLAAAVRDMINIYNNVQLDWPVLVYQVISGAQSGTFLIFQAFPTLAEWDKYPAILRSLRETGGRKFDAVEATLNDITAFNESRLMSISPKMSYVTREFSSADPEFWTPKPKPPAAKPMRSAAKPPAAQ